MKKLLFIISSLLYVSAGFGQLPLYYVYLKKGNASIQTIRVKKIVPLQSGTFIYENDLLIIKGNNTEVKLMGYDRKLLTADKPGSVKGGDLAKVYTPAPLKITEKYFELIWNDLFRPHAQGAPISKDDIASSWGAANRGRDDCDPGRIPVNGTYFESEPIVFKWNNDTAEKSFLLTFYDSRARILSQYTVPDTLFVVNDAIWRRKSGDSSYYWSVKASSSKCKTGPSRKFYLLARPSYERKVFELIKSIPESRDRMIYNLEVSDVLGKKGFITESYHYYQLAMRK